MQHEFPVMGIPRRVDLRGRKLNALAKQTLAALHLPMVDIPAELRRLRVKALTQPLTLAETLRLKRLQARCRSIWSTT